VMADAPSRTALHCLVAVARHHGLDLSAERLAHDHALGEGEVPLARLLRIAREAGLRARHVRLDWEDLPGLGGAFPVLAPLGNGNWVVLAGVQGTGPEAAAVVFDPLSGSAGLLLVPREQFLARWQGELVLLKRLGRPTDGLDTGLR
ncbi:MAG TPA: cysteine peptidase family C39 domain-containing protein, partial [Kiloniellaceae bacterium]|nr:cysteine peptidase family C39 domain-containing protein [Kiloniellaceae bacterium]